MASNNAELQAEGYKNYKLIATDAMKETVAAHQLRVLLPLIEKSETKPQTIMEIGFNDGRLMRKLREVYPDSHFHGTEVRDTHIDRLRSEGFDVTVVTDEIIPGEETFDLIYGASVLHHLAEPYKFIQKAYDRLNKNGLLLFICEGHRYNLPSIAYSTVKRSWNLEKHMLKLTKGKVSRFVADIADESRVWYEDASYFAPLSGFYSVYKFFGGRRIFLLNELHVLLAKR